jgi:hypothetical protein
VIQRLIRALVVLGLLLWGSPTQAAVAFVQSATGTGDGVSTVAVTVTVTSGNVMAVFIGWYVATNTLSSVTDTQGNTYTLLDNPTTYINKRGALAHAVMASSGSNTVTATFSATTDVPQIIIHEISGVNTTTPIDNNQHLMAGGEATGTDAVTTGNITTTQNGDYIFCGATASGITLTAGSNSPAYTNRATVNGVLSQVSRSEDQVQTSAGTISGRFTPSGANNWVVGVMAFQPAAAGAACTPTLTLLGVGRCGD